VYVLLAMAKSKAAGGESNIVASVWRNSVSIAKMKYQRNNAATQQNNSIAAAKNISWRK